MEFYLYWAKDIFQLLGDSTTFVCCCITIAYLWTLLRRNRDREDTVTTLPILIVVQLALIFIEGMLYTSADI